MKIDIICSSASHPINSSLEAWRSIKGASHSIDILRRKKDAKGGDILFLISCVEIVEATIRARYAATIVLHASDLPEGRGWSPFVWQVAGGAKQVVVCALEAADSVDTGAIWAKTTIEIKGDEDINALNKSLFAAQIELMDKIVDRFADLKPQSQSPGPGTWYRRRTPEDSRLDPEKSIAAQFDLLRVCDPDRYPAFIEYRGRKFKITLERMDDKDD